MAGHIVIPEGMYSVDETENGGARVVMTVEIPFAQQARLPCPPLPTPGRIAPGIHLSDRRCIITRDSLSISAKHVAMKHASIGSRLGKSRSSDSQAPSPVRDVDSTCRTW